MVKFCTSCGAAMQEGTTFCTACGARLDGAASSAAPDPGSQAAAAVYPAPEPRQQTGESGGASYPPPGQTAGRPVYPAPGIAQEKKPVSTVGFMLLQLLYAIPIVGFFSSLVLAIAPEKKDLKHHALANFIWKLVLLALFSFGAVRFYRTVWKNVDFSVFSQGNLPESFQDLLDDMGIELDGLDGQ